MIGAWKYPDKSKEKWDTAGTNKISFVILPTTVSMLIRGSRSTNRKSLVKMAGSNNEVSGKVDLWQICGIGNSRGFGKLSIKTRDIHARQIGQFESHKAEG
jgi:hypothetical protein